MRKTWWVMVALLVFAMVATVYAQEKEATLKGKVTCLKCDLNKADKCTTVIVVKEGGKDVIYQFDADAHKKYHGPICKEGKEGTVTGTVSEKEGKKFIKVNKVDYGK
ncbi:MAG TPA: DUF6370 family protein [Gemmataceae bacterium]|nr:DUF6370 family protein [Gemmataceae bacterium]